MTIQSEGQKVNLTKEQITDMFNYISYCNGKLLNELTPYTFDEWIEKVKPYDN